MLIDVLARSVRSGGSRPFLTYYDLDTGERTEFSLTSFANWVDKTANLLDTLDVAGEPVLGALSLTHPGHWVSLIWPLATWQSGGSWQLPGVADHEAALRVQGPQDPGPVLPDATVVCSLHPLGLPSRDLPDGTIDYTTEVLAEPDAHLPTQVPGAVIAWRDATQEVSHADLLAVPPSGQRVLVQPGSAWDTLRDGIIAPLLGGGSSVIVVGDPEPERLSRIVATERVAG